MNISGVAEFMSEFSSNLANAPDQDDNFKTNLNIRCHIVARNGASNWRSFGRLHSARSNKKEHGSICQHAPAKDYFGVSSVFAVHRMQNE